MNEQEAFALLTLASARDNRTVSQSIAAVWAGDLEFVSFADGAAALTLFYREQPDTWLKPGHVVAGAYRVKDARAIALGPVFCSEHDGYPLPCDRCVRDEVTC
jgi:hypothetical protein